MDATIHRCNLRLNQGSYRRGDWELLEAKRSRQRDTLGWNKTTWLRDARELMADSVLPQLKASHRAIDAVGLSVSLSATRMG